MSINKKENNIAKKIRELYAITQDLEQMYPGRKFTPDGHLVGSIGEVLVADYYKLTLMPNSSETHDAVTQSGCFVQIKTTQIERISISSKPDNLIVIKLFGDGSWEEVYNGPGAIVWQQAGKMQKNGQRSISLSKLRTIMNEVAEDERI